MNHRPLAAIAAACLVVSQSVLCQAAALSIDDPSNYSGGWGSGSNGGAGTWATANFLDGGSAGTFLGSGDWGTSFGLYANGGGYPKVAAFRSFATPLAAGQAVHVNMDNNGINTDGFVGFAIRNQNNNLVADDYSANSLATFGFVGGRTSYSAIDGTSPSYPTNGSAGSVPLGFTNAGLQVNMVLTSSTTYNLFVTLKNSTSTISLLNRSLGQTIGTSSSISLFNRNSGVNSDLYFGRIEQVTAQTFSGTGSFTTTGNWTDSLRPTHGDNIVLGGASAGTVTNDLLNVVNSLSFASGAGAKTLANSSGNSLGVAAGIANQSSSAQAISANLNLLADQNIDAGSNAGASLAISGTVSGSGKLTKAGTGKLTLSSTNSYGGGTTISAGTLVANGARSTSTSDSATGGGAVTIASGGTLAGTGGVRDVTVNNGGKITAGDGAAAGDNAGTLTTGNQTWNNGGTFVAKFKTTTNGGAATSNGTNWDKLAMGTLTLSATGGGFTIQLMPNSGTLTLAAGQQWQIATFTNTLTQAAIDAAITLTYDHVIVTNGSTPRLQVGGGGTSLMLDTGGQAAAPEPTTAMLVGLGGTAVMGRRRRR